MATVADDPSAPGLPSAHSSQLRTCIVCRQRRVKCDRRLPRCSSCVRSDAHCIYPSGRGRAPKRPRREVTTPQLSERLSRLESIISQLGASTTTTGSTTRRSTLSASPITHEAGENYGRSFDEDFSRLKVDDLESYYVNNPLWVKLADEVEEFRDLLFEPASDDSVPCNLAPIPYYSSSNPRSPNAGAGNASSQLGLNAAIFGYRAIYPSLQQHFHPSLPQAALLFTAFTDNVSPLVRIFHMPTLTRVYWDAVASLDSLDNSTEALLAAIHYSAVISLSPEQCLSILDEWRETVLERYRFAAEQALARGNLLNTQSMTMLQAAVLFLSALPNEDDSRAAWSLTALIYHIARTMGLHRDGTTFGLTPFATELRRRLWWQICIIDSRCSEYHCNEPIARGSASDTKPPLHIDDADLSPEMVEQPLERWDRATDMTLSLIRCEVIQAGWKLGHVREKQPSGSNCRDTASTPDGTSDAATKRQAIISDLEARLRDKYLPICDLSVPLQFLSSAVAQIVLARFQLVTQYSLASRRAEIDQQSERRTRELEANTRNQLFQLSIQILEVSGLLLTKRDTMQFIWYSKTHIQWGAMAFVLSELCARPVDSPECDRAWHCVTTVNDGWRRVDANQGDDSRLALWRPIQRLRAKVLHLREMQRTDPARASRSVAQRHNSAGAGAVAVAAGAGAGAPSPFLPATSSGSGSVLSHPLAAHTSTSFWSASSQTTTSYVPPIPEHSSDSTHSVPRVFGTDALAPLMYLFPEWTWTELDGDNDPSALDFWFSDYPTAPIA